MTKEIRHVINHNRFAWSLDDLILPVLEIWALYYIGSIGYDRMAEGTSIPRTIEGALWIILSVAGIVLSIRRLFQLNAFTVLETSLDQEGNFLFCLDRVKMFNIDKREFDKWNYCVGVRAHSNTNPLPFWLTLICYENKIFVNERPAFNLLSLWWVRNGATSMIAEIRALQQNGKEAADAEIESIRQSFAERQAARDRGELASTTDAMEVHLIQDPNAPELYSPSAISWFSLLVTPLAGTLLLMFNVNVKDRLKVLGWGGLYSVCGFYLLYLLPTSIMITLYINMFGGYLITTSLWNMYVDKNLKYRSRPIWIPLVIGLITFLIAFWFIF